MGQNSTIEWCDHTFNPWWGCHEISPGCDHCYARVWDRRTGGDHWGPPRETARRFFGERHWNEPLRWNREAERDGVRRRVFCASMGDVFEAHPALTEPRERLWRLILETPHLDWLLLTKRIELVRHLAPWEWVADGFPDNVWLGTTVENQEWADRRIPILLSYKVRVHFLSMEPLLGPVDLTPPEERDRRVNRDRWLQEIEWIIVGGESGPHARPMHPAWVREIRDRCQERTDMGRPWPLPFLFKQWGEWAPAAIEAGRDEAFRYVLAQNGLGWPMERVGKKAAGRLLDGREWNEVPS